jgi:membrane-bound serine protease (ClpP class)
VPVREAEGTTGRSFTQGTWWSLRSTGAPLRAGTDARVVDIDGLVLLVDPATDEDDEGTADERSSQPGKDRP